MWFFFQNLTWSSLPPPDGGKYPGLIWAGGAGGDNGLCGCWIRTKNEYC